MTAAPDTRTEAPERVLEASATAESEPGIHQGYDEEAYHRDPALSYSSAKILLEPGGPARYRWSRTHPEPHRAVFDEGTAAHQLVTGVGPELVDVGADAWRGTHKAEVDQIRDDGKLPLKHDSWVKVHDMADALADLPVAYDLVTSPGSQPEVSIWQTDEPTGRLIRGRIDLITDDWLIDFKTTAKDADPDEFARRSAIDYRYYLQAFWYRQLDWLGRPLVFIVQSKNPPYLASAVRLPGVYELRAETEMREAIDLWDHCLTTNTWPGHPNRIVTAEPSPWFNPTPERTINV